MLRKVRESNLVKPICGLMLSSMILSFSIGIFGASTPGKAFKPVPTKVLSKAPDSVKQTTSTSNITAVNNQTTQVNLGDNNQVTSDSQNPNPVTQQTTTWENRTNWAPVNTVKTPAKASQPMPNSKVDIYLLARVIYAESRGEPFEGQVAVGAVLMNRLKDSRFPKSLSQIIFKRGEFCTVRDGQIWKNPSQESIKAARLAAAGWDPTGGALYFYNPAKTTSRWIWSRPVVNRIGNHIFAA